MNIFLEIKKLLNSKRINYKVIEHEAVYTSEQAAKARNEDISIGAKALVLKIDDKYIMAVLSGAKKINSKKLKKILNCKNINFATPEKVIELTSCIIGSVPPFGNLFNLKTYIDKNLLKNKEIAFNAGKHTKSIKMKSSDYVKIVNPIIEDFSK